MLLNNYQYNSNHTISSVSVVSIKAITSRPGFINAWLNSNSFKYSTMCLFGLHDSDQHSICSPPICLHSHFIPCQRHTTHYMISVLCTYKKSLFLLNYDYNDCNFIRKLTLYILPSCLQIFISDVKLVKLEVLIIYFFTFFMCFLRWRN